MLAISYLEESEISTSFADLAYDFFSVGGTQVNERNWLGDDLGELGSLGMGSDVVLGEIMVFNSGGEEGRGHVCLGRRTDRGDSRELRGRLEEIEECLCTQRVDVDPKSWLTLSWRFFFWVNQKQEKQPVEKKKKTS